MHSPFRPLPVEPRRKPYTLGAWIGQHVQPRKPSLSTAVSIASSFQVAIDRQPFGEIALAAPLSKNIVSNFLVANQFSIQRLKLQHSTGQQTELSRTGFGIVIGPFSGRTAVVRGIRIE